MERWTEQTSVHLPADWGGYGGRTHNSKATVQELSRKGNWLATKSPKLYDHGSLQTFVDGKEGSNGRWTAEHMEDILRPIEGKSSGNNRKVCGFDTLPQTRLESKGKMTILPTHLPQEVRFRQHGLKAFTWMLHRCLSEELS